jgi:hypothetical protein
MLDESCCEIKDENGAKYLLVKKQGRRLSTWKYASKGGGRREGHVNTSYLNVK